MAKNIILAAPSGFTSPTLALFTDGSDVAVATVTLTEDTNCKGRYRGVTTAAAAIYWGRLDSGASTVGTYNYVRVEDDAGGDTTAYVTDNARDHWKLRQNTDWANQAGDNHQVIATEI